MDSKTVIMFGAAAASLWALQQIKDTQHLQHKKVSEPFAPQNEPARAEDGKKNVYVLTRIADAYAQAAEREADLLQKLSHWQAAKHALWVARLLWSPDDPALDEKFSAYSDMEAGVQNQIRETMVTRGAPAAVSDVPAEEPAQPPLPQEATTPAASFFPSSPFDASPAQSSGKDMPDALQPIKTKTSKGGDVDDSRVQPYSADLN